jgi:hypothetical protein
MSRELRDGFADDIDLFWHGLLTVPAARPQLSHRRLEFPAPPPRIPSHVRVVAFLADAAIPFPFSYLSISLEGLPASMPLAQPVRRRRANHSIIDPTSSRNSPCRRAGIGRTCRALFACRLPGIPHRWGQKRQCRSDIVRLERQIAPTTGMPITSVKFTRQKPHLTTKNARNRANSFPRTTPGAIRFAAQPCDSPRPPFPKSPSRPIDPHTPDANRIPAQPHERPDPRAGNHRPAVLQSLRVCACH